MAQEDHKNQLQQGQRTAFLATLLTVILAVGKGVEGIIIFFVLNIKDSLLILLDANLDPELQDEIEGEVVQKQPAGKNNCTFSLSWKLRTSQERIGP